MVIERRILKIYRAFSSQKGGLRETWHGSCLYIFVDEERKWQRRFVDPGFRTFKLNISEGFT